MKKNVNQFDKMIVKINKQFNSIDYRTEDCDISDLGNEIGIALGKQLMNPDEYKQFLHGINHGIDLVKRMKTK